VRDSDATMSTTEERVIEALRSAGADYEVIEIDPEFSDTAAFCAKYGYPPERTCNTILVAAKKGPKKYAACVALAHTRLDVNRCVRRLLGAPKASFATPEEMIEVTGMEVGGVTPFSLPPGLPVYVDERVMACEWVIFGGGARRIKVRAAPGVLVTCGAEVVTGLAVE